MEAETQFERRQPEKDNGGVWVTLGSVQLKVPPLNFRALRELESTLQKLSAISAVPTGEQVDAMMEVAYRAVIRNYPQMTKDEFMDLLDIANIRELLRAIMAVAGAKERKPGE